MYETLTIQIIAFIGILVSSYLLYVEIKVKKDENYKAVCDFNDRVSCTKNVKSKYSKIFGISNSLAGMLFYILVLILSLFSIKIIFYLSIFALAVSIYLGYISFFKLKNTCIMCTSTYILNILIFVVSYRYVF